ncbi:hypothetical protein [Helicobacter bilis]|uniref:hypothetical protein n=1 Tax=Helicobacter bilis TaxID=37372 RepID=UPI0025580AE3|nr:hypothetical protein [Helicobacter bilis]
MLEKRIQAEQDRQRLKSFNEYKEFMNLQRKIKNIDYMLQTTQKNLAEFESKEIYQQEILPIKILL